MKANSTDSSKARSKRLQRPRGVVIGLICCVLLFSPGAGAAKEPSNGDTPEVAEASEWRFLVNLYGWVPEMHGTVKAKDVTAGIDIGLGQVFDLLGNGDALAGAGHFEVQRGRFSFFVDAFGGTARPSTDVVLGRRDQIEGTADLTMNYLFFEFGPAYRVLEYRGESASRPILVDVLAGGRFMYFYESVRLLGSGPAGFDQSINTSTTWVDPFIGGRFLVPLVGDLDILFRGDIGGFGAGSDLAWNLLGGLSYTLPWRPLGAETAIVAVYKAIDFDWESDGGQLRIDLNMRGPAVGMAFRF